MKVHRWLRPVLLVFVLRGLSGLSLAQFGFGINVSIGVAPPPLPVYDQPPCPQAGYVWTPGYWAWSDEGYYWVPGTWVQPPQVGLVWTPGYWGWDDDDQAYMWNDGYWGEQVGFYGGVDYGYGYPGEGYYGGYWQGNNFYYNDAVNNVREVHITTVYSKPVPARSTVEHVSYSGGQGGVQARPTPQQLQARSTHHIEATAAQKQQVQVAKSNPQLLAKNNNGKPAVAATAKPGDLSHAVQAKQAGGHVDQKALQADAKTAAKPSKKSGAARTESGAAKNDNARPSASGNAAETGSARERNVPKPSNSREAETSGSRARATEPSADRPENKGREAGNASGMPQSEGAAHRAPEPPSRSSEAERKTEPQRGNSAASHEKQGERGKDKDESDKPEKNDKPQ